MYKSGSYSPEDLSKQESYKAVISETNRLIQKSVKAGIKTEIPEVMRESLDNDVFLFSALRTHAQLFEASRLLTNDDGTIRSEYQFQQAIKGIYEDYNINYLDAERNFALASAQSAANWADVEKDGDEYNLQYRTAMDEKVREQHRALEGITLPPSDSFWNMYYTPNGWRCRCVAVQVRKSKYETTDPDKAMEAGEAATTKIGTNGKNKLEIFRFNPGKQKVIFPPKHPYNKVKGASEVKKIAKDLNK